MICANKQIYEDRFAQTAAPASVAPTVRHRVATIGLEVIPYLDAGYRNAPALLVLAGHERSLESLCRLVADLATRYRVIAPRLARGPVVAANEEAVGRKVLIESLLDQLCVGRFGLYLVDVGLKDGWLGATKDPGRLTSIIIQSGRDAFNGFARTWEQACSGDWSTYQDSRLCELVAEVRRTLADWTSQMRPPVLLLWTSGNHPALDRAEPYERLPAIEIQISSDEPAVWPDGTAEISPRITDFLARHDRRDQPEYLSL